MRAQYDGTPIKDYDLFFRSVEDFDYCLMELYYATDWAYDPASHGRAPSFHSPCGKVFNLVGFAFEEPRAQLDGFDFRCNMIAGMLVGGVAHLTSRDSAIDDAEARILTVVNNNGTERTMRRVEKYVREYGYTVAHEDEQPLDDEPAEAPSGHLLSTPEALGLRRARRRVMRLPVSSRGYD